MVLPDARRRVGWHRRASATAFIATIVILLPIIATAAPATVDGVIFSDELGGLDVDRVAGHGSIDDPFVVVERLTNPDGATLLIRNWQAGSEGARHGGTV